MSEFDYSEQLVALLGRWRVGGYSKVTNTLFEIILADFDYHFDYHGDRPYHTFGTDTRLQADEVESIIAQSMRGNMTIAEVYERIKNNELVVEIQFAP